MEIIKNNKITEIKSYGNDKNKVVIETVATFINYYNYLNTPTKTMLKAVDNALEIRDINYKFQDSPAVELIYSQCQKIVLDGVVKEEKTKEDLARFFNIYPYLFKEILEDIKENSSDSDNFLLN